MHILVTDILACPRCRPESGLILLADRIEDRQVITGLLGCPSCRAEFPIRGGAADFGGNGETIGSSADTVATERLAALLGVMQGPAFLLLAGEAAAHAPALAGLLADVEVLTIGAAASPDDGAGINRILAAGPHLPIASGRIAGVALRGSAAADLLEEGARVVAPAGRLVLEAAPADAAERLRRHGLRVAAQEAGVIVAVRG